ncbi:MAG: LamG domain-containing protein [Clostridiales bacterium]|nr:LamG domain-containing protein [Clostridiales bacterium]
MKKKMLVAVIAMLISLSVTTTALAATPIYENGFDGTLGGAQTLTRKGDNENGGNAGTMPEVDTSVKAQFQEGKNSQALYLDGTYGVLLDAEPAGSSYTIAFWINPAGFSNYGPLVQIGSDLLSQNASAKWLNITKTDWDGDMAPVMWSRNETTAAWPWFSGGPGYLMPSNEWTHIAVTVDASTPGLEANTVLGKLYINGEYLSEGNVATEVFEGDAKIYLGINCWDINMKGLIDDFKVYNTVLNEEEIKEAMNTPASTSASSTTSSEGSAKSTSTEATPKTGAVSYALVYGLVALGAGAGAVVLRKKEDK